MSRCPPPDWAVRTAADRAALAAGCYWDAAAADAVVRFARTHVLPQFTGAEFTLFLWQERFLRSLYGWRNADGTRRFRYAVLHVPKKNGKTLIASVVALYELFGAGTPEPVVVSASTDRHNAGQVFDQMKSSVTRNPKLADVCKVTAGKKRISLTGRAGEYWAMSSDKGGAEGWNISCGVVDEAHAHRSAGLFHALEYGTIGRLNGLLLVISTAGEDLTHWYYALVTRARAVLSGAAEHDRAVYCEVYEADPDKDDLDDPATWQKANPSLGLYPAFSEAWLGEQWAAAKPDTARRLSFLRYRLNVFCRPEEEPWIDLAAWDAARRDVPAAELAGRPCWLGFDGSLTTDPTSLAAVWQLPGGRFHCHAWAWVAEAGVRRREKSNLTRYQAFAADGSMTVTPGDLIDKAQVRRHIDGMKRAGHKIRGVVADPHGAHVWGAELQEAGYAFDFMAQNFASFTAPTVQFAAAVRAGTLTHSGAGWLRWCVHSVRLAVADGDRCRPSKAKSRDKIDGAVAALMAFRGAFAAAADPAAGRGRGFAAV